MLRKFGEDQAANQAVLIAWNALFAMFPIVLVILGVVGAVLNAAGVGSGAVQRDLIAVFPGPVQAEVQKALDQVKQQTGVFFMVGFAGLVWSGTNLFGTMEYSFDLLWRAERRSFIRMRLMATSMMAIFSVLTVIAVGTAALLPWLGQVPDLPRFLSGPIAAGLQVVIGVATGFALFGSMYYVVPNRRQSLGVVWPGALLAGVLFEGLTLLFPLYLRFNKGIDQYGSSFGLMFLLMTFFYFLGLITMLGAEVNAILYPVPVTRAGKDAADPIPPPPARTERLPEARASRSKAGREPERRVAEAKPTAGARRALLAILGVAIGLFALRKGRDLA